MEIDQFLIIMMVAVIVAIVAKYIRWPYTIMLLLSGLVIAYFNIDPPFVLDKKMIFHILLPPLIFEGALHMRLKHLKENAKVISLLAIPALILSSFFVGYLIYLFTASSAASAIPFTIALLIAIIIIPTDPVSILAIYKETKLPTKLKNIIEGESIFDDGTCLVLFAVILDLIRVGNVDILTGITDFLRMAIFGILLGLAVGYILYMIISKIDDKFTEVMITLIMVFGLFAMAENMGASGVFAVVMAGLILGNYGTRFAMAPSARHTLLSFWGFIVFLVNSFLFIVVGMNVNLGAVWDEIGLVIFSVLALWSARALSIYIIGKIVNRGDPHFLPNKWQIVMWWGGLRGAIPIALALSIPIFLVGDPAYDILPPETRDTILAVTFGVVLITLLVQGLSLKPLIKKLGFYTVSKKEAEKEEREIATLLRDTVDELIQLKDDGEISSAAYDWLIHRYSQANSQLLTELGLLVQEHGFIPREEYTYSVKETLEDKKGAVKEAWEKKLITGNIGERLLLEIESQISVLALETDTLRTPREVLRSVTKASNGQSTDLDRSCALCMCPIEPGLETVKCRCGTTFHKTCTVDADRCPVCIAPLDNGEEEYDPPEYT